MSIFFVNEINIWMYFQFMEIIVNNNFYHMFVSCQGADGNGGKNERINCCNWE